MTKIMIFGTFDMIHPGHENFFEQARALANDDPQLYVSVARDSAVMRHKNARPQKPEEDRRALLQQHPLVDVAVLGDEDGYISHIKKISPDIIALGYDQAGEYVKSLADDLREAGLNSAIVRLLPFKPDVYKTSLLRKSSGTLPS